MTGARNTSVEVVAVWAKQWGPDIYRYCRKYLASDSEAEDAMQVTFLQALQDFARFRGDGELQWLISIARHRCLDRLKLLRRRGDSSLEGDAAAMEVAAPAQAPDDALARSEAAKVLSKCVDQLPGPTRAAVILRYHEQLSYQRIEAETGATAGSLRVRVSRGLEQLKECLERQGMPW